MALTHQATGVVNSGTGLTASAVVPSTTTTGRLLVWEVFVVGTSLGFTVPGGWTVRNGAGGTGSAIAGGALYIMTKTGVSGDSGSTQSATFTGTMTGWRSVISVYDNFDTSYAGTWTNTTNSGTMNTTTLTTTILTVPQANGTMLYCCVDNVNGSYTPDAATTERVDNGSTTPTATLGSFDEAAPASGSTTSRTTTASVSTSSWGAVAVWMPGLGASTPTLTQSTFRGRNDDGSETTATWKATAGTDWTQAVDTNFRVRFNISDSVAAATQNTAFVLRYSLNAGAYTAVSASSSVVRASASANVADGAATTEQLAGAGTFNAGTFDEVDGSATGFTAATSTGQDTEVEYSVQIRGVDVANGNTINLRVYDNAGAALNGGYTDTPIITVSKPATSLIFDPISPLHRLLRSM